MEKIKPRKKHLRAQNPVAELIFNIVVDSAWPILKNLASDLSEELKKLKLSNPQKNPQEKK